MEDFDGNPLKPLKDGSPNPGLFNFGVAIPKRPGETHFSQSIWGAIIWAQGHRDYPQVAQAPTFSWKVTDGDSTIPGKPYKGKPGRAPKDKPGYPGHWVFSFSGSFDMQVFVKPSPTVFQKLSDAEIENVVHVGDNIILAGSTIGN